MVIIIAFIIKTRGGQSKAIWGGRGQSRDIVRGSLVKKSPVHSFLVRPLNSYWTQMNLTQAGWQKFAAFRRAQKCQPHICYFRNKCAVLRVIANLIQYNMQYITSNSALLSQETLFLTPKKYFFCPKSSTKMRKLRQIFISLQNILGLKFFVQV